MNELYCLRCHDKMGIPICGACRRPIEERVVTALGKHWHVEHFVCAKCEKPFLGHRHYEKRGLAYCETHYHQLFGNLCFVCNQVIAGDGEFAKQDKQTWLLYAKFTFLFQFSPHWIRPGVYIISRALFATRKWIKSRNSMNTTRSPFAKNATRNSQLSFVVD